MAGTIDLILVALLGIFCISLLAGICYLFIKYLDDKRKNPDYLLKEYQDSMEFMINNCPESIYKFQLRIASTKESEGRPLGRIVGYAYFQIPNLNEKKPDTSKNYKHCIVYLSKTNEFSIFKPQTWVKKYSVAIIDTKEMPYGLNGNVVWECAGIERYKWYVFSISDQIVTKEGIARKISTNIALMSVADTYKNYARIVNEALESDAHLKKDIKRHSELDTRRA